MSDALRRDIEACEAMTGEFDNDAAVAFRVRAKSRWPAALAVVQAVMEIRRTFGNAPLPLSIQEALQAFEEEE